MNLKPAVSKNFVFDWALCFRLCEVYRFQNLVGLESPIKHALTFKGAFRENQMLAKVRIVILIEKQIMSALRNRFPFLDCTSQTQDIEENIRTDFNFNTLLFLSFVVGEKGCKFSLLSAGWSSVSFDGFVACRS